MAKPLNEFGGWLRFFQVICWLTLIVYGVNVFVITGLVLDQPTPQKIFSFVVLIFGIGFLLFLIWKILRLLTVKAPEIPGRIVKKMLVFTIVAALFSLADTCFSYWIYGMALSFRDARDFLRPIAWYLIWSSYFRKSKRVVAHYGANAAGKG